MDNLLQRYETYSGKQFNETYKGINLYKFLKGDLKHRNFTFKKGLNVDTETFTSYGDNEKGGFSFCTIMHGYFRLNNSDKIATIRIPDDAKVYLEYHQFKADKIEILSVTDSTKMPIDFWDNLFKNDKWSFGFIDNKYQTKEICALAVKYNGYALNSVKEEFKTNEISKLAVQQTGYAIRYVKEQTDELCKLAVQQDGGALVYIKNQTDELCVLAVKQNGSVLHLVKNQTKDICEFAVQQKKIALYQIKDREIYISIRDQ